MTGRAEKIVKPNDTRSGAGCATLPQTMDNNFVQKECIDAVYNSKRWKVCVAIMNEGRRSQKKLSGHNIGKIKIDMKEKTTKDGKRIVEREETSIRDDDIRCIKEREQSESSAERI